MFSFFVSYNVCDGKLHEVRPYSVPIVRLSPSVVFKSTSTELFMKMTELQPLLIQLSQVMRFYYLVYFLTLKIKPIAFSF